jgi:hypothetical protein
MTECVCLSTPAACTISIYVSSLHYDSMLFSTAKQPLSSSLLAGACAHGTRSLPPFCGVAPPCAVAFLFLEMSNNPSCLQLCTLVVFFFVAAIYWRWRGGGGGGGRRHKGSTPLTGEPLGWSATLERRACLWCTWQQGGGAGTKQLSGQFAKPKQHGTHQSTASSYIPSRASACSSTKPAESTGRSGRSACKQRVTPNHSKL